MKYEICNNKLHYYLIVLSKSIKKRETSVMNLREGESTSNVALKTIFS
jgi:hypothetical protein